MPTFGRGRHNAAFGLLIAGSIALIGSQQVLSSVADAEARPVVDAHNLMPLPAAVSPAMASPVNAAVPTGQFEELVRPTPVPTPAPTVEPAPVQIEAPKPVAYETGVASTYGEGDGFEGNLTACGQVFRTDIVQVAHKSLPCGTMLRIEDTDTGLTVDAEVTDRGPYIRGRIVDLSWGAFRQLDPSGPGLLHVNIYLLDE